jgi:hypothetical protein
VWLTAVAASMLMALLTGMCLEHARLAVAPSSTPEIVSPTKAAPERPAERTTKTGPLMATVSVRTNLDPAVPMQLQVPIAPASDARPRTTLTASERRKWEQRGYEVHEETRYLLATLPDGREVLVPVNKVRLKYRGVPVS